jgi:hypothetical protein
MIVREITLNSHAQNEAMINSMGGYLVYHPRRARHQVNGVTAHADPVKGNQDPYIWSSRFLHTFCHMAQMSPEVGEVCFWVTGDRWPDFNALYCDLVFVIQEKVYWRQANAIARNDTLVDSEHAWNDHYQWGNHEHQYKRRRRFTLKADAVASFQPQAEGGELIDVVPFFVDEGHSVKTLRQWLYANGRSRPRRIDDLAPRFYRWLFTRALMRRSGAEFESIRLKQPQLGSPPPDGSSGCCGHGASSCY